MSIVNIMEGYPVRIWYGIIWRRALPSRSAVREHYTGT